MNHVLRGRRSFAYYFALAAAVISFVGLWVVIGVQLYIRWYVNQNFTLLGGGELEVLTGSIPVLVLGVAYLDRMSSVE